MHTVSVLSGRKRACVLTNYKHERLKKRLCWRRGEKVEEWRKTT